MTAKQKPFRVGDLAGWITDPPPLPESLLEDISELPGDAVALLDAAWNEYHIAEQIRETTRPKVGTPAEQDKAAAALANDCANLAKTLGGIDLQHRGAAAWHLAQQHGIDLIALQEDTARALRQIAWAYVAAGATNPDKRGIDRRMANRDALARAVIAAVDPHCENDAEVAAFVADMFEHAGIDSEPRNDYVKQQRELARQE